MDNEFMNNNAFAPKNLMAYIGLQFISALAQKGVEEAFEAKKTRLKRQYAALHIYDKEYDIVYKLVRPMTNDEKVEYSTRVENGELIGKVLKDMKILDPKA